MEFLDVIDAMLAATAVPPASVLVARTSNRQRQLRAVRLGNPTQEAGGAPVVLSSDGASAA